MFKTDEGEDINSIIRLLQTLMRLLNILFLLYYAILSSVKWIFSIVVGATDSNFFFSLHTERFGLMLYARLTHNDNKTFIAAVE